MIDKDKEINSLIEKLSKVNKKEELDRVKSFYLGKEGLISSLLQNLKSAPQEQKKELGRLINELKQQIELLIKEKYEDLEKRKEQEILLKEWEDLSIPQSNKGSFHPLTITIEKIKKIFTNMGFSLEEGPQVEKEEYNFDMLNVPKDHPARDMQDTFYINKDGYLLRTHTSPVQIRTMLNKKPPIYAIAPGKVYRKDYDPTHSPMFHQVEGLAVDKNINLKHMKYVIDGFLKAFFNRDIKIRYRSSYFPFTEPSFEVDIECIMCEGKGCKVCKETGWLEVMGSGIVHYNVLRNCDIDPEFYSGFAFGMGVERLAMLYYKINDIRLFYENDIRFLRNFSGLIF